MKYLLVTEAGKPNHQPALKMTFSEKFCLKLKNFQDNIASSIHGLREDMDFSDVTLVCEEDKQIEAHRVILSACSPFFSSVLKRNKHSHPMIYMRGLKSKDLVAIVDFIYHGETSIYHYTIIKINISIFKLFYISF